MTGAEPLSLLYMDVRSKLHSSGQYSSDSGSAPVMFDCGYEC